MQTPVSPRTAPAGWASPPWEAWAAGVDSTSLRFVLPFRVRGLALSRPMDNGLRLRSITFLLFVRAQTSDSRTSLP
jgi:hypothetical protein